MERSDTHYELEPMGRLRWVSLRSTAPYDRAALTSRSYNPIIKAFAQCLSAATSGGKPFKIIMTACMR